MRAHPNSLVLAEFDEVSDRLFSAEELDWVELDRSLNRYDEVFGLAKFILREVSPSREDRAKTAVYSLMFDMNRVFEEFIAVELQQALLQTRFSVRTQLGDRSLLRQDGRPRFQLRPDIGVFLRGDPVCIMDTKWKMLEPFDDPPVQLPQLRFRKVVDLHVRRSPGQLKSMQSPPGFTRLLRVAAFPVGGFQCCFYVRIHRWQKTGLTGNFK